MAVQTVGFLLIAIFSLGLILALMTGLLNPAPLTCFVYRAFSSGNPDMELPGYCREETCALARVTINSSSAEATQLAAYAVACYTSKKAPCPKTNATAVCYELRIPNGLYATEEDVTKVMERDYESGCMLLPNSMISTPSGPENYAGSCGTEDRLEWQLSGGETLVLVEYDTESNRVVIR